MICARFNSNTVGAFADWMGVVSATSRGMSTVVKRMGVLVTLARAIALAFG